MSALCVSDVPGVDGELADWLGGVSDDKFDKSRTSGEFYLVVLSMLEPGVAGEDGGWVWVIDIALFSCLPIGSFDSEELSGLRDIVDVEWSALGDEGSVSMMAAFTVI